MRKLNGRKRWLLTIMALLVVVVLLITSTVYVVHQINVQDAGQPPHNANLTAPVATAHVAGPGFTNYYGSVDWANYTLTNYVVSTTVNGVQMFDTPILTKHSPTHVLTAYYVNVSGSTLVSYNFNTGTYNTLHSWVLFSHDAAYGLCNPYNLANNSVGIIYDVGAYKSYDYVQEYNLYNGSYVLYNTTTPASSINPSGPASMGLYGSNGLVWLAETNTSSTTFTFWNVYTGAHFTKVSITISAGDPNGVVFFPYVNQMIMDGNNGTSHQIQIIAWNFTGSALNVFSFNTSSYSFITGPDENNMPYLVNNLSNGTTMVWGIGGNYAGPSTQYHNLEIYLFPNMRKDVPVNVILTGSTGTTDIGNNYHYDASGYWLNGYNLGNGTASAQVPFLDPINKTSISATPSSSWLNTYVGTTVFGYGKVSGTSTVVDRFYYIGITGWEGMLLNSTTGQLTVYWINR